MKRIYIYAAAAFCGLTMTTSCMKEDVSGLSDHALEISAEKSGQKTTVNGATVKWVKGDLVWVDGVEGTVTQSGGHWYVDGSFNVSSEFNLFYPVTLATAMGAENQDAATATVVFPSRYASSFDGDNQEIALPMAARSSNSATAVELKHLSSGINLVVINNTGNTLWVDSVSITSATENLSGQALVTLSIDTLPIVSAGVDGSKSVTVYFDSAFAIANNGDKSIQVPVIPNATALGDLTVKVFSHDTMSTLSVQYLTFTKTKSAAPALVRNAVAALRVEITTDGSEMTRHILGAFSVSATKKVYFSMGNLQYKGGETYPWRFALNQYDCMGANGMWNTSDWVDLFGWGTWTGNNVNPLRTPYDYSQYSWDNEDFVKESELADATQRGFDWRTLNSKEWVYVVNTNNNSGRSDTYRFAKATVTANRIKGVILFPDGFTLPTDVTINNRNTHTAAFNSNVISDAVWSKLEAEGCIFLPAAGCRKESTVQEVDKMGGYHSSTAYSNSDDNKMRFENAKLEPAKNGGKMWGNSVRLVRDAN